MGSSKSRAPKRTIGAERLPTILDKYVDMFSRRCASCIGCSLPVLLLFVLGKLEVSLSMSTATFRRPAQSIKQKSAESKTRFSRWPGHVRLSSQHQHPHTSVRCTSRRPLYLSNWFWQTGSYPTPAPKINLAHWPQTRDAPRDPQRCRASIHINCLVSAMVASPQRRSSLSMPLVCSPKT